MRQENDGKNLGRGKNDGRMGVQGRMRVKGSQVGKKRKRWGRSRRRN